MRVNVRKIPSGAGKTAAKGAKKASGAGKTAAKGAKKASGYGGKHSTKGPKKKEAPAKETKMQKLVKGMASASTAESMQDASADTFDATSAKMTNTRLRKQASTKGKAQSIIKNKSVGK